MQEITLDRRGRPVSIKLMRHGPMITKGISDSWEEDLHWNDDSSDENKESKFSTDTVFISRQNLIDWVHHTGKSLGYVIVTKRSKTSTIIFHCDRSGIYKSKKISTKNTGTKKINCPFELEGKRSAMEDSWTLRVICEMHNHEPALHLEGHPYARRLTDNEARLVEDLSRKNVKPRDLFHIRLSNVSGFFAYLNKVWLTPYKEMFVHCWTDKYLNFGNHTTNRVESQHAKLKRYLDSSKSDLETTVTYIHQVIQSQVTSIKASVEQSKIVFRHRFKDLHFDELRGFVSSHALDIIFKEYDRAKVVGSLAENCGCQLRTSHGLPCAHEQSMYLHKRQPIPLDSLDLFWRKLDLSPCISMKDDDIGCEAELEMLNAQFKKQSRSGKRSLLRKLMEIIAPSTTLVREPATHTATRGRPSLKTQSFRKMRAEKPPEPQASRRRSCSSAPKVGEYKEPARHSSFFKNLNEEAPRHSSFFMDLNEEAPRHSSFFMDLNEEPPRDSSFFMDLNEEPPRDSSFFMDLNEEPLGQCSYHFESNEIPSKRDSYLWKQIPTLFHPYITKIQDVRGDGNCGFRSIAVWLGYGEDQWPYVRRELLDELESSYSRYSRVFYGIEEIHTSLSFWESPAPEQHWMTMPETGILIANTFGVIFQLLTIKGSMTCFPLWKGPEEFQYHRVFTISNINNIHYVVVELKEEYPMPTISALWTRNKIPSAAGWQTMYKSRLELYEKLKPPQSAFIGIED
ncbi:hypothetical protein OSB04_008329 [Centaurea solstitialis]|uniref:Protein FAR1-RELATED SEQUENCE n=1 Tax=Centaurea solstitialis TaxID=347529 RepID=A0AA38TNA8_9ASTR|nr:hypothetical protein OSB04_008329 [Centaurea solstitialis]